MLEKFKEAPLVPFAIICDQTGLYNDDYVTLALFDGSDQSASPRVRIYDYGTPKKSPWDRLSYDNFEAWLEAAKEESADYKSEGTRRFPRARLDRNPLPRYLNHWLLSLGEGPNNSQSGAPL